MIRRLLFFAFAFGVAGIVGGSLVVGDKLMTPAPKAIGPPPPWIDAQTVTISSDSGSDLSGWLFESESPDAVVVLMHPIRGNRHSMLGRARFLSKAGLSVLLFDFQAHGESPGDRITFGHLESIDAVAAVNFAKRRFADIPIIVLGTSLGGAAALLADPPLPIDGLIVEAVFPDAATAASNRLRLRFGAIGELLTPLLTIQLKSRLGISPKALSPVSAAAKVSIPVLVISGSDDKRTTQEDTHRLFDAFNSEKSLWIVEGARHEDLHAYSGGVYERKILDFVIDAAGKAREIQ